MNRMEHILRMHFIAYKNAEQEFKAFREGYLLSKRTQEKPAKKRVHVGKPKNSDTKGYSEYYGVRMTKSFYNFLRDAHEMHTFCTQIKKLRGFKKDYIYSSFYLFSQEGKSVGVIARLQNRWNGNSATSPSKINHLPSY